jgi:hypothetical protein
VETLESRALLSSNAVPTWAMGSDFLNPLSGVTLGPNSDGSGPGNTAPTSGSVSNVNTDTEDIPGPHNETSIAVNPTNSQNMIGSVNDYQLRLNPGGQVYETVDSRAHVTSDGGKTWTNVPINYNSYNATGDPSVAFDASGNAYLGTLGFRFSQGKSLNETNADVLVAHSSDGGQTWSDPVRVASGTGNSGSVSTSSNDKDYLAAWGDGNAIVTWAVFNTGQKGSYISSPIYASVTHDGGKTWTPGVPISGSLVMDEFSDPVVTAGGKILVAFESGDANVSSTGNDRYYVVQVDPTTGKPLGAPTKVADLVDGFTAYPFNSIGDQTYQDSQFRTNSAGNMAADPTSANHLAVVWSDMRDSTTPAPADPYSASTNSDIVVSQSFDGGKTWSLSPVAIALPNDQFMPWAAYNSQGLLQIGFFDRSYTSANHKYGYTLASETTPGSLSFTFQEVTDTLSDPTKNDAWFSGTTVNSSFPNPTEFLGDYSNIAVAPTGVAAFWTDMRNPVTFGTHSGSGEDAYFSLVSSPTSPSGSPSASPNSGLVGNTVMIGPVDQASDGALNTTLLPNGKRRPG